jgi:conjugal transfer pilus assembly protein TraV
MQGKQLIMMLSLSFALSGCAGWINPYASDFTCPKTEDGKCVSVSTAYEESLNKEPRAGAAGSSARPGDGIRAYEQEMFRKLTGLIREPTAPLVKPPTVMRGLVLYYPGDENELYSYRYVYFFADKPTFVLGDYLNGDIEGEDR